MDSLIPLIPLDCADPKCRWPQVLDALPAGLQAALDGGSAGLASGGVGRSQSPNASADDANGASLQAAALGGGEATLLPTAGPPGHMLQAASAPLNASPTCALCPEPPPLPELVSRFAAFEAPKCLCRKPAHPLTRIDESSRLSCL